jgi:hypothetical protein
MIGLFCLPKFTTYFSTRNGTLLLTRRWAWSRPAGNDASLLPYNFFSIETYGSPVS